MDWKAEELDQLYDKILDREELSLDESLLVKNLNNDQALEETEQKIFDELDQQDDPVFDFNGDYFQDIRERNVVLAKIRAKSFQLQGIEI